MPVLTTRTVAGQISLADGVDPVNARVRFTISGYDNDAPEGITIIPLFVEAEVGSGGAISIELWPTEDGTRSRFYTVATVIRNAGLPDTVLPLGRIVVPSGTGDLDLEDLMDAFAATVGEDWGSVTNPATNFADYGAL